MNRLNAMKKKGLTDDNYKRIVAWMEDPESSTMDIFMYLESIKNHCKTPGQMNGVASSLIQLSRTIHGSKDSNKTEINIIPEQKIAYVQEMNIEIMNIVADFPECKKKVMDYLDHKQKKELVDNEENK